MLSCPPECAQVFFCPFAFPHFLSSFASKLPLAEPARSHKWSVTADTVVGFYVLRVAQPMEPHQTTPAARRNHGSQESRPCRRFTPELSANRKLHINGLGGHQLRCPRRGLMARINGSPCLAITSACRYPTVCASMLQCLHSVPLPWT